MLKIAHLIVGMWIYLSLPPSSEAGQCPPFNASGLADFVTVEQLNSTTVQVKCTSGMAFHTDGNNYTRPCVTPVHAYCQLSTGKWTVDSVACWKGLAVNVGSVVQRPLPTQKPVVLVCVNVDPVIYTDVTLHLGHHKLKDRLLAWTNVTFTWDKDNILVRCEYSTLNETKATAWKQIRLQYEPGFDKPRSKIYELRIGGTAVVEIPVHSMKGNLQDSDVMIFKGDKEFKSFFITHHKRHVQFIIVKFENFQRSDAGNYTIVLRHSHDHQETKTIMITAQTQFSPSAAATAGVTVGCLLVVVIFVVGIAYGLRRFKRSKHRGSESNDDVFLPSRSGIRHMLIVDDAEDDGRASTASSNVSGDQRPADGWRRPIELVETRGSLDEVDIVGADRPGTSHVH